MHIIRALLLIISISFCVTENPVTEIILNNDMIPFVNEKLQIYINKLFYSLKINKKFRSLYKTKLLLIMYENLNNAIEFNWQVFSNIKNSVIVSNFVKANFLYKVVDDILTNKEDIHRNTTEVVKQNNVTEIKTTAYTIKKDNNEYDMKELATTTKLTKTTSSSENYQFDIDVFDKMLKQINNLTADDLINRPINKTYLEINEENRYKLLSRRSMNLKTWDPNELPDDKFHLTRRMANAELVKKYPFVASIHVMDRFTCTGSIISKNAVLTAASCLPFSYDNKMIQQMPDIIQVRIGSDYANHFGEKVPIVDVEFHPRYQTKTLKNNLAVIRLNKLQKYARSRPKIRKIRLDNLVGARSDLKNVQILGFGAGNEDLKQENQQLVVVNLDLMPVNQCKNVYSGQFVSDQDFCAGFKASRRNSHCNGDVGAPGVADGYLVGIVSFGPPVCGGHDAPTVFLKTRMYTPWIEQILQKFKLPHPGEHDRSREFHSTSLFLEEDEEIPLPNAPGALRTTRALHHNHDDQKHHVFRQIKSILSHVSNPIDHYRYTRKTTKFRLRSPKVLNDDDKEDDPYKLIFEDDATKTTPLIHHPLINKSIMPIPGVHYTPMSTTRRKTTTKFERPDIGLPEHLPYDYIHDRIKNSEEFDYFVQLVLKEYENAGVGHLRHNRSPLDDTVNKDTALLGDKDSKEVLKEVFKSKLARISKTMQKFRERNKKKHNLQPTKQISISGEENTFARFGNGKIMELKRYRY